MALPDPVGRSHGCRTPRDPSGGLRRTGAGRKSLGATDVERSMTAFEPLPSRRGLGGRIPRCAGGLRGGPGQGLFLLALLLALPAVLPSPAAGQVVQGRVSDLAGGEPVDAAMVVLLDEEGRRRASTLTNASGLFRLDAPSAGLFRVRVERIGFRSAYSDLHRLTPGDTAFIGVEVDVRPIPLTGIDVEGSGRCEVRPEEGVATARVWEEARKALAAAAWTDEMELYRYRLVEYVRRRDRRGREVARPDSTVSERFLGTPFSAPPVDSLLPEGFVRPEGEDVIYYGPDAEVLLSDLFLDSHCMRLRRGEDEARGLVGLAFEPIEERPGEVRGVLWLDPASSELRWLDWEYVDLGDLGLRGDAGGRVVFEGLPNGAWIVRDWEIRMPVMGGGLLSRRGRRVGTRVQGASVLSVRDGLGRTVLSVESGVVTGVVVDSTGQRPASAAEVRLVETGRTAVADSAGVFHFAGLPDGSYRVAATTPALRTLGWDGEPVAVEARRGRISTVRLALPSVVDVALGLCGTVDSEYDGILLGTVRDNALGTFAAGASVRVGWVAGPGEAPGRSSAGSRSGDEEEGDRVEVETVTDPGGRYLVCGVPRGRPLAVEVRAGDGPPSSFTVVLSPRVRLRVRDVTLPGG